MFLGGQYKATIWPYMGQFPEDGNFGRLCLFFKQKATVAKPIDIDDFCWFVLTNYDLCMAKKSNLTPPIKKNCPKFSLYLGEKNQKFGKKVVRPRFLK